MASHGGDSSEVRTSAAKLEAQGPGVGAGAGVQGKGADRIPILDAVKGLLVVLMVLYHWLNYFVVRDGDIYKYLRFITPSFIFVTGFVITSVYLGRYRVGEWRLHERLLTRGLKLLVLFTVLNLLANAVLNTNYEGTQLGVGTFVSRAFAVYVVGGGQGVAFEVLVPIGYLLAASSLLLMGCKLHKHFLLGLWLVCVGSVYGLKWWGMGSVNVELFSMGLLGMVVGCFGMQRIDRVARPAVAWIGAYVLYLGVLSVYNVMFELQVVGLILNAALLYGAAKRLGGTGTVVRKVILLGQYSLFAYIAHIVILQVLARTMPPTDWWMGTYVVSLSVALALTLVAVETTGWVRRHSVLMDRLYRAVFA